MDFSRDGFKKIESMDFNEVRFNPDSGVLLKSTDQKKEILKNEIFWYLLLPEELSFFVPEVFSYHIADEDVWVKLEYYDYKLLSKKYLRNNLNVEEWEDIIDQLIDCVKHFTKYKFRFNEKNYKKMYLEKTKNRVSSSIKKGFSLFEKSSIKINGKSYRGWQNINEKLSDFVDFLIDSDCSTIIHGDLHLGNILYSEQESIIKLIDPRGSWGENIIFGDFKYDFAKLRHSFKGQYNFIVNDKFDLTYSSESIEYQIDYNDGLDEISNYFDKKISNIVDLEKIIFIEGLLFFSMIDLHSDFEKKVLMFSKGIEKLNKVLFLNE